MNYENYIKDKRVIFVGGAPNLIGLNKGKEIDSYDIVVRSNGGYPVQDKLKKDYGTKTNVIYINNQFKRHIARLKRPYQWYFDKGISFLNFKSIKSKDKRIRNLSPLISDILSKTKIPGLLMGPVIFTDILAMQPKELFITGIDFMYSKSKTYKPFDYPEYYKGYLPKEVEIEGNAVKEKNCSGHNLYYNTIYIAKLFEIGNLKTDLFIYKIMQRIIKKEEKKNES